MQKGKSSKMLIFLDLETTGLEAEDKICALGIIGVGSSDTFTTNELVNEGKKIPPKASSINHITNEMIKGKPPLKESGAWKFLNENNNIDSVIIGHNIGYDLKMLSEAGMIWHGGIIDTLRAARHLISECEEFSLQYLRYELKLYLQESKEASKYGIKPEDLRAHDALSDALHVKLLYEYLLDMSSHEELMELSFKNVILQKFDFGKYQGRYIEEICMYDRGYVMWLLENIADMDEDLRYTLHIYLEQ